MKGGNLQEYCDIWYKYVSPELFKIVYYYYSNINYDFLVDKMKRELHRGNAGGPQVLSRFSRKIPLDTLARASIDGLCVLLTIKTFENVFPFKEKTRITDDSMLTDLAWHSLMLKPHKYYMITHTIIKFISTHKSSKDYIKMNRSIRKKIRQINKDVRVPNLLDGDDDDYVHRFDSPLSTPTTHYTNVSAKHAIVKHGTDKEVKLEIDIRDFIYELVSNKSYGLDNVNMAGYEWNMPLPLFPKFPYNKLKAS